MIRLLLLILQFALKYLALLVIPSVSNCLDTDQARHLVGPDLGPNCLQRYQQNDKIYCLQAKR